MKKGSFVVLVLVLGLIPVMACAQDKPHDLAAEIKAEVPALEQMHEVIYPLWHTAWANKDTAMMVELLPDIVKKAEAVTKSELPGILRDKQVKWNAAVEALNATVSEYKTAIEKQDKQQLLDAAETLHRNYEMLVRIVSPVLDEMEAFHGSLYPLYHYYIATYDAAKVESAVADLKVKMDALNKAVLPERRQKRNDAFVAARIILSASVDDLVKTVETKDENKIKAAVEKMHTAYQGLEKVFE
ncbi:MAG: hypothetical protein NTW14_08460 [bacterium]|nr:hypothetical protein [bacterium]